jgi:S1-C subfamily serine protease
VNARGQLIGINTAIFSQSGGYQGIGFAVPVYMARQVMEQFVSRGAVTRGYLGVAVQEITPTIARGLGSPRRTASWSATWCPAGRPRRPDCGTAT